MQKTITSFLLLLITCYTYAQGTLGCPPPNQPNQPQGADTICSSGLQGYTYTIDAVPTATSYQWVIFPNGCGTLIVNGTTAVVDWSPAFCGNASISVIAVSNCGSSLQSNPIIVSVLCGNQTTFGQEGPFCATPDTFHLSATPAGGVWSGTNITSDGIFSPSTPGTYSATYTTSVGSCTYTANSTYVVGPAQPASISVPGIICENSQPVQLVGLPAGGTWYPSSIFDPQVPGADTVIYYPTGQYGCADRNDTVIISPSPLPIANFSYTITNCNQVCITDMSLYAGAWFLDFADGSAGNIVSNCHIYPDNGIYCVVLQVANACGTDTAIQCITINCVGIEEDLAENSISIYPNPAQEQVTILFNDATPGNYLVRLIDVMGKLVLQRDLANNGNNSYTLPLQGIANGIYNVHIINSNGKSINRRLIVN